MPSTTCYGWSKARSSSADEQGRALAAILEELKIEGLTRNFLLLAAKNRRLFAIPDMIRAFRAMLARHRGEIERRP